MAEIWDYWLYSMNAPFGRTRGGEPDSPYNGFCTITHFQICRGLDQVRLAHTMASPVPAVDVEVGGTADVLAQASPHDCGESSGAGAEAAEGARAGSKRPRAPKCKPGEETSCVQFKRAPPSWAAEVLAASTELGARPDDALTQAPADPDMVVRGKRLQPRLCSRIGAPPTPVVRSPPRGHATASRRRPPASTATCRPPSARLPATSVRTQAPSRFHHRRVIPRHGWRTRGRAVPSAQHPVRARRWRGTGPRG